MWNQKTIEKKQKNLTEQNWKAVNGNLLNDLRLPLKMNQGSRHFTMPFSGDPRYMEAPASMQQV